MSYKPSKETPDLIPYLIVRDAEASIKFYRDAFGFEAGTISKDDKGNIMHVEMTRGPVLIMFCPEGAFESAGKDANTRTPVKAPKTQGITMPINLYMYCEDTNKLYAQAIKNGAISKMEPNDAFWGDRYCAVTDIDGYEWSFGTFLNK